MPISDEALEKEKNRFIAVKGEATVGQAIAALQDLKGQPWWHLVVRMDDGSWGATRFVDLCQKLGPSSDSSQVRLGSQGNFVTAISVERDSLETKMAETLAEKSESGVLVVTVNGVPAGILIGRVSRGGLSVSSASLSEISGSYVDLKDYSLILLSSSRKPVNPPKPESSAAKP